MGCSVNEKLMIDHLDSNLYYQGRVSQDLDKGTHFYWPGTSVSINFEATDIYAELKDETGNNYYQVILDGIPTQVIKPSTKKQRYLLASGLKPGSHHLQLFRKTEYPTGKTTFYNFSLSQRCQTASKRHAQEIKNRVLWRFYHRWPCLRRPS